jgi:Phospholipase_D-nuclease N-terminal
VDFTTHPFLNVMWTFFIIWVWVAFFWLLIMVISDVFRRHDLSGAGKAGWTIIVLILPFIGALIYLITQGSNMAERRRA